MQLPAKCNRCNSRSVVREEKHYKCMACTRVGPSPDEIGEAVHRIESGDRRLAPRHLGPRIKEE